MAANVRIAILGAMKEEEIEVSLLEDILSLGVDCQFVHVNESEKALDADVVYVVRCIRKFDYTELSKKVRCVNSSESTKNARDKIKTTKLLQAANLSQPDYVLAQSYEEVLQFTKEKGQTIMKFTWGCAGQLHTVLTYDSGSLISHTDRGQHKLQDKGDHILIGKDLCFIPPYLVQEFISFDGSETNDKVFRVYVTSDKANFGTVRIKDNVSSLSDSIINIAQGAHYEFIPNLNQEMKELAVKTADVVGFESGVVDILRDKDGRFYVIECDCDGKFMIVDRKFMKRPDYCDRYSFNKMIGKRLIEIAQGADYRK